MRLILLALSFIALCGCHHIGETHHHRTVSVLAYDNDTGNEVAVFTITQSAYDYADDSNIYLTARNLTDAPISFNFTLNVDGNGDYYWNSFNYSNAVVELPSNAIQNFGRISEARLNIYDSNIYLTSPYVIVYQPSGPG